MSAATCAPKCADCGVALTRRDQQRCGPCANVHRSARRGASALVDAHTPYAEDRACQALVEAHPEGMDLDEIGAALGVTRERARQIETAALASSARRCQVAGITAETFAALMAERVDEPVYPEPWS